jgi:hypothetical protein
MRRFGDVLYNLHGSTVVRLNEDWVRQPLAAGEPARVVPNLRVSGGASGEYAARRGAQR